ncbi:hypothetical protein PFNF54_04130 [Plasmodium falciparum NF54]|uniref:Uncharacterized protein n=1 Tax=Plasmodium falciparum (isolate NF54) TaxID=5843 RepID=W7K2G9_PLAFO|nr:hypothetical protein PFNF54_04130 [Plasmodium falciparum NF54]
MCLNNNKKNNSYNKGQYNINDNTNFIMIIVNIINSLHFLLFKNNTRCFIFHSLESYNLFMNKTEEII